jgi:3-oxoacyl-[acyl-carrier-protein] synthase I
MMAGRCHIVANGARTPVGLQSESAAAAVRAGISGLGEHPFLTDRLGQPLPGALDARLDPRLVGPERLIELAGAALREACAPLGNMAAPCPRLPVYLSLPEFRPGFTEQDSEAVRSGLSRIAGMATKLSDVHVFPAGNAGGVLALAEATERMEQGLFGACLVGGVDSYFHPDTMAWLDANRQLVGMKSRSGFIPGEGAGFVVLMTEAVRARLELRPLALVRAVSRGNETKLIKSEEVCLGEGLIATVRNAVSCLQRPGERVNDIICDVNGERYRGEEWGFVCLKLSQYFDDPTAYLSPADCWGDMGAASIPLFAMLACQAAQRGYAKGARILLWASSAGGLRGAAVLETNLAP